MADEYEETVILEDILKENDKSNNPQNKDITKKKAKKNKLIISIILLLAVIIISVIIFILLGEEEEIYEYEEPIKKNIFKPQISKFKKSKVERLIEKANMLYSKGEKKESISIFKEVAKYNESLSFYNLGVIKLQEKIYKEALTLFQQAINSKEEICISAINAAVASLHLKNYKLFKYYISLAKAYLPQEKGKPLYHHYLALVNYYLDFYKESLVALNHPNSNFYNYNDGYLKSKLYLALGEDNKALNELEQLEYKKQNNLTLGLLNARIGSFEVAKNYLLKANTNNLKQKQKINYALALINIKLGNMQEASNNLDNLQKDLNTSTAKHIYKITSSLKPSLFNPQIAQKEFQKFGLFSKENKYSMLFYFTPYKIFNANKSVEYIRKGSINYTNGAKSSGYFKLAQNLSSNNLKILDGILSAMDYDLLKAKSIFSKLLITNSKDSVLHYNLALVLAQLGEYKEAYKLFIKSYHLNKNFYLAGIYALMCGELSSENNFLENLKKEILDDLQSELNNTKVPFYKALLSIYSSTELGAREYLDNKTKTSGLILVVKSIISAEVGYKTSYIYFTKQLIELFPKDIISNILYIDSAHVHVHETMQEYAKNIQMNLQHKKLNLKPLYYGYEFITKIYTKYMLLSGLLYKVKHHLNQQLKIETKNIKGILKSIAYVSLYTKDFKKSFTYYNELIDTYAIKDSKTLFYAAISAIGAKESANAIALLEISKFKNKDNFESRFALAILYLELGNIKGATIELANINTSNFQSKYFSFNLL